MNKNEFYKKIHGMKGRELDMLFAELVAGRDPQNARVGLKNPHTGEYEPCYYWGYPAGHDFAPWYSTRMSLLWHWVLETDLFGDYALSKYLSGGDERWQVSKIRAEYDHVCNYPMLIHGVVATGSTAELAVCRALLMEAQYALRLQVR